MQPKLLAVREGRHFRPAHLQETSTYIAKLPSGSLNNTIENEFLTLQACRALLLGDDVAEALITPLKEVNEQALLVKRFDRLRSGAKIRGRR